MRLRAYFVAAGVLTCGVASITCSHTQYAEPPGPDGSNEGALEDTYFVPDTFECDPCTLVCSCTTGDTYFNPGKCMTVTCGASGMWGGSCLGLGCEDAEPAETGEPTDGSPDGSDGATNPDASGDAADATSADAGTG